MSVRRYRSIEEMPRPWRASEDPENLREVARMFALYRSLADESAGTPGVRRFRTIAEANVGRDDPYRR